MSCSIVIATCGRPERLAIGLKAVERAIRQAAGDYQIIVVDNGPEYPAEQVVAKFSRETGLIIYYMQSEVRNKSKALNAGCRAAKSAWLAFTDDDTLPDSQWLRSAEDYAQTSGCDVFGGRISSGVVDKPLPKWFPPDMAHRLLWIGAFVDYAPLSANGFIDGRLVPFGANFFIKKDLLDRMGGYDEELWEVCGKAALGAEDAELGMRIRRSGARIGYCHEALVVHPIHHERIKISILLKLAFYYGWRDPLVDVNPDSRMFRGYPRILLTHVWGVLVGCVRRDGAAMVESGLLASRCAGTMCCLMSPSYRGWIRMKSRRDGARLPH